MLVAGVSINSTARVGIGLALEGKQVEGGVDQFDYLSNDRSHPGGEAAAEGGINQFKQKNSHRYRRHCRRTHVGGRPVLGDSVARPLVTWGKDWGR